MVRAVSASVSFINTCLLNTNPGSALVWALQQQGRSLRRGGWWRPSYLRVKVLCLRRRRVRRWLGGTSWLWRTTVGVRKDFTRYPVACSSYISNLSSFTPIDRVRTNLLCQVHTYECPCDTISIRWLRYRYSLSWFLSVVRELDQLPNSEPLRL